MSKRLIVLLGMFLGSHVPAVAQTLPPQMVLTEERIAPTTPMLRTLSTPLPAASFQLYLDRGNSLAHLSDPFAGAYERDHSLERLAPMESSRTLFLTRSSLPLVQLWGRRLQLDVFQSTLHAQNVQFGPSAAGGLQDFRPPRQSYPGGPHSVEFSGFSLSFRFGRDARAGRPIQTWRSLSRIVGTVLN